MEKLDLKEKEDLTDLENQSKEKFVHPVRKDWFRIFIMTVYVIGFISIIGHFFYESVNLPDKLAEPPANTTSGQTPLSSSPPANNLGPGTKVNNTETLVTLVVKPITENPIIGSILKHAFFLIVYIFVFLLFPIAFTRLKRFKFFNFEFEVEKSGESVIEVLNTTAQKINILSKWTTDKYANDFAKQNLNTIVESIEYVLGEVSKDYLENLNLNLEHKVYNTTEFKRDLTIPYIVKKNYDSAKARAATIPINKENKNHLYLRNYLLTVVEFDKKEYVIVVKSFEAEFDEYDSVLFTGLISLANHYFERTKQLKIIDSVGEIFKRIQNVIGN
ncbi:hypothetical protein ACFFJY_00365 [Fictibacillus aquaticus]|uniref:Uncharacterized protein n=1 Tax=Fictibacillus aquaticus TaxID=2021314 RepID=A0A235F817_9BACL|nr:hypothetical protein [Fictibacillus aquaticus]OYD57183.1 hypothetical protein CGZ90_10845 [Fictibacillus aquaticus]